MTRRELLNAIAAVALTGTACRTRSEPMQLTASTDTSPRQPVLFLGHGSPMNALETNRWSDGWRTLAGQLPRPRAILCISAHWYVGGTWVTGQAAPPTIHDFGGFPQALFEVHYPAKGDDTLARRISSLLADWQGAPRNDWGLDHGCWSVLVHLRPAADVPVLQLSIDRRLPPERHLAIGRALRPLRDEGVLILGSGNITHNLRHAFSSDGVTTPDWAERFDRDAAQALGQHDAAWLSQALSRDDGRLAHPTPDHYLPLLYAAGAADEGDAVQFLNTGFDYGSLSMRSVRFG